MAPKQRRFGKATLNLFLYELTFLISPPSSPQKSKQARVTASNSVEALQSFRNNYATA